MCDDMGNLNISSDRRATEGAPKKSSSSTSKKPGTITTAAAATAKRKGKIQVNKENISPQDAATELNTTSSALGLWRKVAIDKCWYALDIEGNLPNTRSTLQPFLRPYEEQWLWKAVVATIPSEQATQ